MHPGWIGGIIGCVIGLAGGVIGTYCSIRNTDSPRERAFMVKMGIVCWVGAIAFLALLLLLPGPWRHLLWAPYGILLPVFIIQCNKRQARIRREEAEKGVEGQTNEGEQREAKAGESE